MLERAQATREHLGSMTHIAQRHEAEALERMMKRGYTKAFTERKRCQCKVCGRFIACRDELTPCEACVVDFLKADGSMTPMPTYPCKRCVDTGGE